MMYRKICVITGSRADYGLLFPILLKIKAAKRLKLQLIATSAHLSNHYGYTYKKIEKDGFKIDVKIDNLFKENNKLSVAKSTGLATMLLAESFEKLKPDVILVLGDRFEAHAAATTAMLMNIPIAHIHGGEITRGAVDEQIRHSITKMSSLHFCSTDSYRNRIIQMGEDPSRVINSGAPGIDNILNMRLLTKARLEKEIDWTFEGQTALFTYHPETLSNEDLNLTIESILTEITLSPLRVLFTYANADSGGRIINGILDKFCKGNPARYKIVKNLGQINYLSVMKYVDLLIGNSSSGIIEAASFEKPVINIGDRQLGRLKGVNIIDSSIQNINESINIAISKEFILNCKNIDNLYGDGNAASIIVDQLLSQSFPLKKFFNDI